MELFLTPAALYGVSLVGMLMHFLKKQIKGESVTEIKNYFKDHFRSTLIAFLSTSIGFLAYYFLLATGQIADVATCVGIGYLSDSLFNKWDSQDGNVIK
jgi:hypothetical protein